MLLLRAVYLHAIRRTYTRPCTVQRLDSKSVNNLAVTTCIQMKGMKLLQVLDLDSAEEELSTLSCVLTMIQSELEANSNFEFIQAFLKLFLQIHGDTVMQHKGLQTQAQQVQQVLASSWSRIDQLLQSTRCMLGFFGNTQM